jgi:hypothetical protein
MSLRALQVLQCVEKGGVRSGAGLTIDVQGMRALHAFGGMKVLRAGPAPLTLVSSASDPHPGALACT